jgi:hypothetical protein
MTHPDRVTEILIRGIFLLRNSELKWYDFVKAYNRRLQGELGPEEMKKAAIGK